MFTMMCEDEGLTAQERQSMEQARFNLDEYLKKLQTEEEERLKAIEQLKARLV